MFKVVNSFGIANGTSRMSEIKLVYSDLVLALGEPMDSDGYKVSGEWIVHNPETNEVFTIYDWKSTDLYNPSAPSVEQFRANPNPQWFNIGGNHIGDVDKFKELLIRQIKWVKDGSKHLEEIINGEAIPLISFKHTSEE